MLNTTIVLITIAVVSGAGSFVMARETVKWSNYLLSNAFIFISRYVSLVAPVLLNFESFKTKMFEVTDTIWYVQITLIS